VISRVACRGSHRSGRTARAAALAATCVLSCALLLPAAPAGASPGPGSTARSDAASDPGDVPTSPTDSLDWAGYVVSGRTFTSVAGDWTEPSVSCSGTKAAQSAFWIGFDGFAASDPTVEQIGTDSDCTKGKKKAPGGPVFYAWYELYPAALVVLSPASYPVSPGDHLSASMHVSGASYTVELTDTDRWTYSNVLTTPTVEPNASAEWIAESPSVCSAGRCKPGPLADFGSVDFTGITTDAGTLTTPALASTAVTMTTKKAKQTLAVPGAPVDGTGFPVTWLAP